MAEGAAAAAAAEARASRVAETRRRGDTFLRAAEAGATLLCLRDMGDPYAAAVRRVEREGARSAAHAARAAGAHPQQLQSTLLPPPSLDAVADAVLAARAERAAEGSPLKRAMSLCLSQRVGALR